MSSSYKVEGDYSDPVPVSSAVASIKIPDCYPGVCVVMHGSGEHSDIVFQLSIIPPA